MQMVQKRSDVNETSQHLKLNVSMFHLKRFTNKSGTDLRRWCAQNQPRRPKRWLEATPSAFHGPPEPAHDHHRHTRSGPQRQRHKNLLGERDWVHHVKLMSFLSILGIIGCGKLTGVWCRGVKLTLRHSLLKQRHGGCSQCYLLGGGGLPSADRPHWFVCEHNFTPVLHVVWRTATRKLKVFKLLQKFEKDCL